MNFIPTLVAAQKIDDLTMLSEVLKKFHYQPRQSGDILTRDLFELFLEAADPECVVLKQADIPLLQDMTRKVVQLKTMESTEFLSAFASLYRQRIDESRVCMNLAAAEPINLFVNDTLKADSANQQAFAKNDTELVKRWKLMLKEGVLDLIFSMPGISDSVFTMSDNEIKAVEPEYRERMRRKLNRWMDRIIDNPAGIESYCRSMLFNAFALCYDPHTEYFSAEEMKIFRTQVTNEGYYFGFLLAEDESGNVYLSGLTPGGAAWKSNMLNKGDYLVAMQWEGQEEIDLTYASLDEIASLLSSSVDKTLNLTVRKADGSIRKVKLKKEKTNSRENIVKSFLLVANSKIGYIYLPGFYSDAQGIGSPGCASDVAKEIVKLSKEGISGLILDLRHNGGGSVKEAVDLAGIFVDTGPMCVFKSRDEKAISLKDMNMGVAYAGPLIVMVDQYSASASEIVAAALQDYQRAVIIGTPTYGKATGQVVIPIDSSLQLNLSNMKDVKEDRGFVKVTTDQVFRITGLSHQKTGVIPDILLADMSYTEGDGERSQTFAFENSRIDKKTYYTPLAPLPIDTLRLMSSQRCLHDSLFLAVEAYNRAYEELDAVPYALISLSAYKKENMELSGFTERIDQLIELRPCNYRVENNQYDKVILAADESYRLINDRDIERLQEDYLLQETFKIINDLILIQSK